MNKNYLKLMFYVLISLIITYLLLLFPFYRYESIIYDSFFKLKGAQNPPEDIILLEIDNKTLENLGTWPLPISTHIGALQKILIQDPRLIAYIMAFPNTNENNPQNDAFYKLALENIDKIIFASKLTQKDVAQTNPSFIPQQEVYQNGVAVDLRSRAQDGVSRRHVVKFSKIYSIEAAIAKKLNYISSFDELPPTFYTNYLGPKGTFKSLSFYDLVNNNVPQNFFKNKIILIHRTDSRNSDHFNTAPVDKELYSFTNLEIHATVLQNIRTKTFINKSSYKINAIITFLALFISIVLTLETTPIIGFISLILCAIFFYLFSFLVFAVSHTSVYTFHPLLTIFLSYYILIPYRLIKENKRRLDIEKENLSLTQIEKFKTNFISLMSHDLKTPIARIHGTAEVLSLENSGIPEKFRPSISSILESSEDLLGFVNNILSVAKIESQKISLNKESRDINNIIESCIKTMNYLSKTKNIKIISSLEPLFSIKIDNHLIRQVISTLIENAIKYSPSGSIIYISSGEVDNYIRINISDSGRGINEEEKKMIFTKFYRGNPNRTNPITGTGLGLYLAKYFVELHHGKIELDSSVNKGSTFSVYLPVN